jgi:ATP-binding cassette subfamily C (CFTR/MRP) protein 1
MSNSTIIEAHRDCSLFRKFETLGGLSAKVEDANLSVGEMQIFILARTILEAGDQEEGLVLLDEATSR